MLLSLLLLVLLGVPRFSVGTDFLDERPQACLLGTGDARELSGARQGCRIQVGRHEAIERAGGSTPVMGRFVQVSHRLLGAAVRLCTVCAPLLLLPRQRVKAQGAGLSGQGEEGMADGAQQGRNGG